MTVTKIGLHALFYIFSDRNENAMKNNTVFKSFIILFAGLLFSGSSVFGQLKESPSGGSKTFQIYCATCHGRDLNGGMAGSLIDGVWQYGKDNEYIKRNIQFGIPHLGMPSYDKTLSAEEIDALVRYINNSEAAAEVIKPEPSTILETMDYDLDVEIWADNLAIPWAIVFLNEDTALITERPGDLLMVVNGELLANAVKGTPKVLHEGQGGLMDVAIDRNYPENGWIYLSYSHALKKKPEEKRPGAMTRIVRGRIRDMNWVDEEVLYEAPHETYLETRHHYGSRIVFDRKGYMYFSLGDRGYQDHAQDPAKPNGKIHRIYPDGSIPEDNPYRDVGLPTLYTLGNRNTQGMAVHPLTDEVWSAEHGPLGGDELNLIKKGKNYGWPVISYGKNYNGSIITDLTHKEGYEQPSFYWKPSIALSGIKFYQGDAFALWQNKMLVTALKDEEVRLLDIEGDRVIHEQLILKNTGRVRDTGMDPSGNIYVVLNSPDRIIKLSIWGEW